MKYSKDTEISPYILSIKDTCNRSTESELPPSFVFSTLLTAISIKADVVVIERESQKITAQDPIIKISELNDIEVPDEAVKYIKCSEDSMIGKNGFRIVFKKGSEIVRQQMDLFRDLPYYIRSLADYCGISKVKKDCSGSFMLIDDVNDKAIEKYEIDCDISRKFIEIRLNHTTE